MIDGVEFAALIVTHRRPDRQDTIRTLRLRGYTGRIVLVLDDTDDTIDEYRSRWGNVDGIEIAVFEKGHPDVDGGDNQRRGSAADKTVLFARHAADSIAAAAGLTHYVLLDDDYNLFRFRFEPTNGGGFLASRGVRDLDGVFDAYVQLLIDVPRVRCVATAQSGDFIGGSGSGIWKTPLPRKVMNAFFLRVGEPLEWVGRLNDDVNTYVTHALRGDLLVTNPAVVLNQAITQQRSGGLTDIYRQFGTYTKSFYTVMMAPAGVTISVIVYRHPRVHHLIRWRHVAPKIVHPRHRKALSSIDVGA